MIAPSFNPIEADLCWVQPAIERIMHEYPDLSADGWACFTDGYRQTNFEKARHTMGTEDFEMQVLTAWHFIGCTYLEDHSSYALKHGAERFGRDEGYVVYVSNGAMIVAAIIRRYAPKREHGSPNCTFLRNGKSDYKHREA